jgi:D-alanyl-D-alanine carboxypeptidase
MRTLSLLATVVLCLGCAPAPIATVSTAPRATPTPAQTAPPGPTVSVAPTATPAASATPFPSPTPTAHSTTPPIASPAGTATYCAVADLVTPNAAYADHPRTYLDWTYRLPEDYFPPDLVNATTGGPAPTQLAVEALGAAEVQARRGDPAYATLLTDDKNAAVRSVIYADLAALRGAALGAGHPLVIMSAFRSYKLQQLTFDYWTRVGGYEQALRTSARPGHSEHQLGTALDFGDGVAAPWEYPDWATTDTGAWLAAHAADFGFVMSFPKGKTPVTCYDYEPWHYRWVGQSLAQQITRSSLALRELQAQGLH